jgi:hypothetical protein
MTDELKTEIMSLLHKNGLGGYGAVRVCDWMIAKLQQAREEEKAKVKSIYTSQKYDSMDEALDALEKYLGIWDKWDKEEK